MAQLMWALQSSSCVISILLTAAWSFTVCFVLFYNAQDSTRQTLFCCFKGVFSRLNISIKSLVAYCFDGASNMSGSPEGIMPTVGIREM